MLSKFLHVFVLINLLASSAGLTIHEHTCKIKGKSYSLYAKDKTCCNAGNNTTCSSDAHPDILNNPTFKRKRCCENKVFYEKLLVESISFDKIYNTDHSVSVEKIFVKRGFKLYHLEVFIQKTLNTFLYQPPPDSRVSLRVLFQSFLC